MSVKWKRPRKLKGLGDVIELLAEPIAKGLDAVFKTNIQGCGACQNRKDKLNEMVPFDKAD